ncbi:MAG: type II toxin-antitoxin system HipA family toxin [Bradymonadales bacterium]|nr:MAG: type II toxin-antitoxin system HipA family toxin [Bradymonadales bacterium]
MSEQKEIIVYADWLDLNGPQLLGSLFATPSRGKEVFYFEYDRDWLKTRAQLLDPSLALSSGKQFTPQGHENFGLFMDSAPDRWGKMIMQRREAFNARKEKRPKRELNPSDYLLGVHDEPRVGGLRFKLTKDGPFLDDDHNMASPPVKRLRELEQAAWIVEQEITDDSEYEKWLKLLIAPGGSLGGARPKASIRYPDNHLWIAKFPSHGDEFDRGAWEFVVHLIAKSAGVTVSDSDLKIFSGKQHTFLTKRFDRTASGQRIHFASAMTMLERQDGDDASKGASYIELAEFLIQHGAKTNEDLEQLWRRIVFNICVSNVDDHLRNHGFLLTSTGWTLAPAFDLNPSENAHGLKLNVSEDDNSLDLDLAREVADVFRVQRKRADQIAKEVEEAVREWPKYASSAGITAGEQARMSSAFRAR